MNEDQLKGILSRAVHVEPQLMSCLIEGPIRENGSSSEIAWCSCGRCISFDDPRKKLLSATSMHYHKGRIQKSVFAA